MIWVFICAHLVAQGLKDVLGADQANETTKSPQLCIAMDIEHRWIGAIMLDLLDHASKVTMLIDNENAPIHCRYCLSTHHCVKDYPELSKKRMPCPFISNVDMAYIWRNNIITCSIIIGNQGPNLVCRYLINIPIHGLLLCWLRWLFIAYYVNALSMLPYFSHEGGNCQPLVFVIYLLGCLCDWIKHPQKKHTYTHTHVHTFSFLQKSLTKYEISKALWLSLASNPTLFIITKLKTKIVSFS